MECKEIQYQDCAGDQNDDLSNENGFLLIGEHENQVSEGGEADLHKHKKNCKKNPGHPEFIPIESFTLKHLPEGHEDIDLYNLIKATADLIVKLSVGMTSPDRPEFWPNTKRPYFLSNMRGKKILRTGSGRVNKVFKYTFKEDNKNNEGDVDEDDDKDDEDNEDNEDDEDGKDDEDDEDDEDGEDDEDDEEDSDFEDDEDLEEENYEKDCDNTCPCDKCKASDNPSKVWWRIHVNTAAHVVVDQIEASHTTLTLFYDREDSEVVLLKDRVRVNEVSIDADWCKLTCVTCDENVGNKLMKMKKQYEEVWGIAWLKYRDSGDIYKLNYIVSHPHGCSKQVSVGQWKDAIPAGKYDKKFTYTTCTCPGSSGAYVHCVGYNWYAHHVHSGSLKSGLNYSGVGWV